MKKEKSAVLSPEAQKKDRLLLAACLLLAALSAGSIVYYIVLPSRTVFQADCSDTLYWAMASYDAGALFSRDFYYATLQPFGGTLLMLPFIPFFGFSMTSHLLGMVLFAVVFMAALWFFTSSLQFGIKAKLLLFSAVLLLLCSSFKLRELLWEHVIYYSLGMLFTMLMLGLCFRLQKALRPQNGDIQKSRALLWGGLLFVLCLLVGTDGLQVMLFCTVPVAGALVAERLVDVKRPLKSRSNVVAAGLVLGMGAASVLGLALVKALSAGVKLTEYTGNHMVYSPMAEWGDNILKLPGYWAALIGFNAQPGENIVSVAGAAELVRLALALLLLVVPVVAAVQYKQIKDRKFRVMLWYHGILTAILLLSHIVGSTANAYWRFAPVAFSAMVVTVWSLLRAFTEKSDWRRLAAVAAAGLLLVCGLNVMTIFTLPTRDGQNAHLYHLMHTLQENGLTHGYADFQVSQPVTVLSANEVKVRYVLMDKDGVSMFAYQTEAQWYQDVPGQEKYFVVTSAEEYEELLAHDAWQALQAEVAEEITSGPYLILVFSENPVGIGKEAA